MNFIPVQARMGHKADHLQRTKKPEDQDHPARKVMNCVSEIQLGMRHINPHLLFKAVCNLLAGIVFILQMKKTKAEGCQPVFLISKLRNCHAFHCNPAFASITATIVPVAILFVINLTMLKHMFYCI